jgi:hypothetical protein
MNYRNALRALSARIRALAEAGEIHTRRMAVNSGDSYGTPVRGNYGEGVVVGAQCTPGQLTQYRVEKPGGELFWALREELTDHAVTVVEPIRKWGARSGSEVDKDPTKTEEPRRLANIRSAGAETARPFCRAGFDEPRDAD